MDKMTNYREIVKQVISQYSRFVPQICKFFVTIGADLLI